MSIRVNKTPNQITQNQSITKYNLWGGGALYEVKSMYFKFYTNYFISLHILVNPVIFIYVNCGTSCQHFIIAIPEDGLYRPKHAGCIFMFLPCNN